MTQRPPLHSPTTPTNSALLLLLLSLVGWQVPLGIPALYAKDSYTAIDPADDDNITAGGSQFVSCVQVSRNRPRRRIAPPALDGAPAAALSNQPLERVLNLPSGGRRCRCFGSGS